MAGLIIPAGVRPGAAARSCRQCRFHGLEGPDVVCRRYPPQVTVVMVPQPAPRAGQLAPQPFATFPPVVPEHVCGEFAAGGRA
ncbi:hypothetical protein HLH34_15280 [Gluconacetobacter azotocaptans]|uniref:Uncharacterized protein n=1 Tax=Gluconacetobacter azotocaptans TaxID=142834 RepID=A0A7W4JUT6_9PROT|nr:hypothetical protein [Gluconacetobacter azotocaptans]MBB2191305.1 hypothetical protein [Gluconacetobacter azotocaptans]MBM9403450.1 hypothetical protein [Gluconacetobacter azotocaptans]GBQ28700.1 hypothetical protein AA13594_1087 [Gluconacetobacter azotocaptans DSM 13594]